MLPQLKTEAYSSQLFWLGICFGLLFVCMRYLIWPRLEALSKQRSQALEETIKKAQALQQETAALQKEDARLLEEAQEKARRIIDETLARSQKASHDFFKEQDLQYEQKMQNLQAMYRLQKEKMVSEAKAMAAPLQKLFADRFLPPEFSSKKKEH